MYSKQQKGYIRNKERSGFKKLKEEENINRNLPNTDDILFTSDFTLEKYEHDGDSGSLLLATNKKTKEKYLIKHEFYDCACNEYMYSKISNKMGIKIAPVKLFLVNDKHKQFKSDFVCGIKYFENSEHINYENLDKENIKNWKDYFRFLGLSSLLLEGDGVEKIRHEDYIYRIDSVDTFTLSHDFIYPLAYEYEFEGINVRNFAERIVMRKAEKNTEGRIFSWNCDKQSFLKNFGEEYLNYYLEPFYLIDEISDEDIKEWIYILTYFYPNIVGNYYEEFLKNIKEDVKEFLNSI